MNNRAIQERYGLQIGDNAQRKPKKRVNMKQRVKAAQARAKRAGLLYLFGSLALLALACLPLLEVTASGEKLWVMTFWKPFTQISGFNLGLIKTLAIPVIYGLTLLVLFVNAIRSLAKLKCLFKRKASRTYGFNRNAFAMEDLGRIYSDNFCAIVLSTFAIYLMGAKYLQLAYIALGVAVFVHIVSGLSGGNVSLFTARAGVAEEKRRYRTFGAFVRNVIQLAATFGVAWFFAKRTSMMAVLISLTENGGFDALKSDTVKLIVTAIEIAIFLCWIVLLKHATGVSEFDRDGREASGRKNFCIFSFFVFLLGAAIVIVEYVKNKVAFMDNLNAIHIAAVALVAFILDLCLCKLPLLKKEYRPEKEEAIEPEYVSTPTSTYMQPPTPQRVPLQCISSPCFINQGGQQYMVMPMSDAQPQGGFDPSYAPVEYYFVGDETEVW